MEKHLVPCSKQISKDCALVVEHVQPNRIGTCFNCKKEYLKEWWKNRKDNHTLITAFPITFND